MPLFRQASNVAYINGGDTILNVNHTVGGYNSQPQPPRLDVIDRGFNGAHVSGPEGSAARYLVVASTESMPTSTAPTAKKKRWPSFLRRAASTTEARNALPTSTTPNPSVSLSQKSELITLLRTGPTTSFPSFPYAAASSANAANVAAVRIRSRGLINIGNMCFANSVLQVLVYCPLFHHLFTELGPLLGARPTANQLKRRSVGATPLVEATIRFLSEFVEKTDEERVVGRNIERVSVGGSRGGRGVLVKKDPREDWIRKSFFPSYVYDAIRGKKSFDAVWAGRQEDAEEFFGFYLDALDQELLRLLHSVDPPRWNRTSAIERESAIASIFGGKFRSVLCVPGQKDSVTIEGWRSLRLDIQQKQIYTIQHALASIFHPQPVQVAQAARQGITSQAWQQVFIEALPPILVLHLKRFCYNAAVGGVLKITKQILFAPELEIGSDITAPGAKKAEPARYKLFGVLYHHGLSAQGGHYTLDVLHPNRYPATNSTPTPREGWVRIDDELVRDVRPDDVFGAWETVDRRCAYLLFYTRLR